MRICRLQVENFRGIRTADLLLPRHGVLIGDNNTGKTTVLEAIDLVLGPDRISRQPPVDEHDFFGGIYMSSAPAPPSKLGQGTDQDLVVTNVDVPLGQVAVEQAAPSPQVPAGDPHIGNDGALEHPRIVVVATVCELNVEQISKFGDYLEFWDASTQTLFTALADGLDSPTISEAVRVTFVGNYDPEEDDFEGRTFFARSLEMDEKPTQFTKRDKQICGFLYLRTLRTGSRALSLERGSLLDIILRLKELRPQMWVDTIADLQALVVASDPKLGISGVLDSIDASLKKFVPKEWGVKPHLHVSNLTRDHLRKVITAFIATGEGSHAAPFYRQGTGTINMLVLAMLTQIAEDKHNVIFAMEEPETAVPPYAQKRIIHEVRKLSSQALFTSHSPYVLEEFAIDETIVLRREADGALAQATIALPNSVKPKRYRREFRTRFCEALLARRVLLAEGVTEYLAFAAVCNRLAELDPTKYSSLEQLGICILDAGSQTTIPDLADMYAGIGKEVFALCDLQTTAQQQLLEQKLGCLLMHGEKGFENLVINGTTDAALHRFALSVTWPATLVAKHPQPITDIRAAVKEFLIAGKGEGVAADFLIQCVESEVPSWLRDACVKLKKLCDPEEPTEPPEIAEATEGSV